MTRILVEPGNPLGFEPEELQDLAERLRDLDSEYDVGIAYSDQFGRAVTWWEVVSIWFASTIGNAVINQIVQVVVDWFRSLYTKEHHSNRPKLIRLVRYERETGEVFEVIEITGSEGQDVTRKPPDEYDKRPRTLPPERS